MSNRTSWSIVAELCFYTSLISFSTLYFCWLFEVSPPVFKILIYVFVSIGVSCMLLSILGFVIDARLQKGPVPPVPAAAASSSTQAVSTVPAIPRPPPAIIYLPPYKKKTDIPPLGDGNSQDTSIEASSMPPSYQSLSMV